MPKEDFIAHEEAVWDKKKIAVGIACGALLFGGLFFIKKYAFPSLFGKSVVDGTNMQKVEGTSVENTQGNNDTNQTDVPHDQPQFSLPSVNGVSRQVQQIQQEITHLNVNDLASSSPQIQQIIQEIQSLPQVPGNIAKQACIQLCNKL
jgi:hypothetical protein